MTPRKGFQPILATLLMLLLPAAGASETDRDELRAFLSSAIASASSFDDRFDAEVWLVDMSGRLARFMPDTAERLAFLQRVHFEAAESNLSPELVLALIEVESSFDQFAISRVGAQGYMQVMPFWKHELGRPEDNLTRTETNLRYGCRILQYYLERENGNLHRALAAYNGSSGSRVYSDKVFRAWSQRWRTTPLPW